MLGRTVLVRDVYERFRGDPVVRANLLKRARAAAAVSHPNVATVFEVGEARTSSSWCSNLCRAKHSMKRRAVDRLAFVRRSPLGFNGPTRWGPGMQKEFYISTFAVATRSHRPTSP